MVNFDTNCVFCTESNATGLTMTCHVCNVRVHVECQSKYDKPECSHCALPLSPFNIQLTQYNYDADMRAVATIMSEYPSLAIIVDSLLDRLPLMSADDQQLVATTMNGLRRDMRNSTNNDYYVIYDIPTRIYNNPPYVVRAVRGFLREAASQALTRTPFSLLMMIEDIDEALGQGRQSIPIAPVPALAAVAPNGAAPLAAAIPMVPAGVTDVDNVQASAAAAAVVAAVLGGGAPDINNFATNAVAVPNAPAVAANVYDPSAAHVNQPRAPTAAFAVDAVLPQLAAATIVPVPPATIVVGHLRVYGTGTVENPYVLDAHSDSDDSTDGMISSSSDDEVDTSISGGAGDRNVRQRV